ncbi:MAG: VOC family protein [Oscillospiraceae bacterium]
MNFKMIHNNYNVRDLDKSINFYINALGLKEKRRKYAKDGSFTLVYMGSESFYHEIELTYLRDFDRDYNLGDNEVHSAFEVDDYEGAYKKHKEMDCICYENKKMGLYFISDPDGYWIEILAANRK